MAHLAGRRVIGVQTEPHDHLRLTPQALSQAMGQARRDGADPRILLVNTPSNPTGSMLDRADVEALALWARETGVTLISDEIYAELAHGWRKHISPAHFYPEGSMVTGGLSKTFSAGGWRLGYAALPPTRAGTKALTALRALVSEIWSATPTPLQEAALVAFTPHTSIDRYIHHCALIHGYITRQLYETLTQRGLPCPRPAGGFYLYPDFSLWRSTLRDRGIRTSQELAQYLLEEWDIATLPGSEFNEEPSTLRLRLSTSLLCEPEHTTSSEEREAVLWQLLDQAEELRPTDKKPRGTLSLPALERAQARWAEVSQTLRTSQTHREM
jgi:aspartate aminotransferase